MSQVNVMVNGRSYMMSCDDGQEQHLLDLGKLFNEKVTELAGALGQVGDARLHLIAGILIADELADARKEMAELKVKMGQLAETIDGHQEKLGSTEATQAEMIIQLAEQVEMVASRLQEA